VQSRIEAARSSTKYWEDLRAELEAGGGVAGSGVSASVDSGASGVGKPEYGALSGVASDVGGEKNGTAKVESNGESKVEVKSETKKKTKAKK